jgi:hypothetical protein
MVKRKDAKNCEHCYREKTHHSSKTAHQLRTATTPRTAAKSKPVEVITDEEAPEVDLADAVEVAAAPLEAPVRDDAAEVMVADVEAAVVEALPRGAAEAW